MPERMLQFVRLPAADAGQARRRPRGARDFDEIYREFDAAEARDAGQPVQPVRRAVLPGALPAVEQHPRLAEADRRGPAGGGLRGQLAPPTTSPKSAAASARRTGCAKATASSRRGSTASPSARSNATSPTPPSTRGWVKPAPPRPRTAQSVGIVGAGPGGLAAAEQLRRQGYAVHVYDRYDRVGGLLIYGIPGFKLEKDIVLRRWKLLEEAGVVFHLNTEIGRDVSLRGAARAGTMRC